MALGLIKNYFDGLAKRYKEEISTIQEGDVVGTNVEGVAVLIFGLVVLAVLISSINILFQNYLISGILGATLFITTAYILW